MSPRSALWMVSFFAFALAIAPSAARAEGAGDDWEVIERHSSEPPPAAAAKQASPEGAPEQEQQPAAAAPEQEASASQQKAINACGERAYPPQPPYTEIMSTLNQLWGSDAKIYESVSASGPHARPGGCIFYNREFLERLTGGWMGIKDSDDLSEMLYAINAHELGHQVHGDMSPERLRVPLETRELEADRFAGYTLWRLNMKRFDAAETERYYQAVGDDFVGASGSHGTGRQRTTAFQEGWDLARMGLPEDKSQRPVGGLDSSEPSAQADQ